ncbi:unnamed protein product [Albugo candida]|uniref:SIN1-type PH domain-containing protein n=2 Tax=Albugo candida TaxID=65357 RepID=A0A024G003_9STRA|nr:unnamed protein product [Albugo candida]|eukprot:CCI39967.1 unnamed protein product [Albugo candida]
MQFTELSELDRAIKMLRISTCNSPTFHDRQDSEVDRIYNSSPKMEIMMRDSWMDRVALKNVSSQSQGNKKNGKNDSMATSFRSGANISSSSKRNVASSVVNKYTESKTQVSNSRPDNASSTKSSQKSKDSKKSDHNSSNGGKEARSDKANIEKTREKESSPAEDAFEFCKEEVKPISNYETSLLDKILRGGAPAHGRTVAMMGNEGSMLHLIIYLPTRCEINLDLRDTSTVEESIQEILRIHEIEARKPPLYYGHSECYELRLHDADGLPDEDFPDRSRKIKNFGDAGGHEYCLCERPDACPPVTESSGDFSKSAITYTKQDSGASSGCATPSVPEKTFLKIFLPKSDDYTVVAVDADTIGQDLLPTLNKKHRLQLFQDQYVLKISEADRERLDLPTDEIDLHTKLRSLNLHEVTLAIKQYADAPQVPVSVTNAVDDTANVDGRSRPPPETFMFNDLTAGVYKEWHVIKKNKYGKKQQRMLGIDINKIYNRKVGERVIKSRTTTKIAERPITSVEWIRFMQDPSDFQIYFKDHLEEIITDYTADSPYECAEIVAKLKYILSRKK